MIVEVVGAKFRAHASGISGIKHTIFEFLNKKLSLLAVIAIILLLFFLVKFIIFTISLVSPDLDKANMMSLFLIIPKSP